MTSSEYAVQILDQRDATVAAGIVALQRAAYRVEADRLGFDGIPPLHEGVDDVRALDLTILGVVECGNVIALVGYARIGARVDIDRLAVRPDRFRRGLAHLLLSEIHQREASATHFDVSTGRDNAPALALYQRLGYRVVADVALPEGVVVTRLVREAAGGS